MKAAPKALTPEYMEEHNEMLHDQEITDPTSFTGSSDICQQLLHRYGNSSAAQHRHLCATAAAARSILQSESLPLSPLSYFAASISTVDDASRKLDSHAVSALATFLSIVLPLVPEKAIVPAKAADAVVVLAELVEKQSEAVSTASVRAVVKSLGVLLRFCDLEDWSSVQFGFQKLLKFSIDRRPKVRRCALDCVISIFKSVESPILVKEASKLVLSLFKYYIPLALEICDSEAVDGSKDEILSKSEHLEVIHVLALLKHVVPYLSVKVSLKVLQELHKLMNPRFSPLTRHVFSVIDVLVETSKNEVVIVEGSSIVKALASYVSFVGKNPNDTLLSVATLLKHVLAKIQISGESKWITNLPLVLGSISGLLNYEASTSSRASDILKELISFHINSNLLTINGEPVDDEDKSSIESSALKSTCAIFENLLFGCAEIPNEHTLAVISVLFRGLGEVSYFYMKGIILKLADMMNLCCENKYDVGHLQECIGSAVIAIGPEKILTLIPINLNAEDLTCSNVWLIPILRKYVTGSSLGFFMEHFVPLAELFQQRFAKARKLGIKTDLEAYAHDFWGLLPAFCRYPTDTSKNFSSFAELLLALLMKKKFMLENIATALQQLVNQNKSALSSKEISCKFAPLTETFALNVSSIEFESKTSYTKKIARKNIKTLELCSKDLLQALVGVFFDSPPEKRAYLTDAIGCLSSITDSSVTKAIFMSSLERFELINEGQGSFTAVEKDGKVCTALELASSFVEGASDDLIALMLKLIKYTLQEGDEVSQSGAYHTLRRLLEEHSGFCSSHVNELVDLLLGLKPPVNITTLRSRFACFQILLVQSISRSSEEQNPKAFLVLNEIILTIKDSTEKARKEAYDMLIGISSNLQRSPSNASPDERYQKLMNMIMGYLSGSPPHIKSGAISALSILVYNNPEICLMVPDLVPSILALLQTKAVEVIKAVLGFVKVLVSCQQAKDLENSLPDIVKAVLQWSSVSRHHFRTKVIVILEIMTRKCGSATIESLAPDKHRNFVKSVLENRHGKARSKESSVPGLELRVPESSLTGKQHKRKREESSIPHKEDGNVKKFRFRKWEKKGKGFTPRRNELPGNRVKPLKDAGNFEHDQMVKGQPRGNASYKRGTFKRDPTGFRSREMNQTKPSKKFGVAGHSPDAANKLAKHRRVGRKQQKH